MSFFLLSCNMDSAKSHKDERLKKLFRYLYDKQSDTVKAKREDEEFYYADVEGTRSQFNQRQMETIEQKHDIPISTKISFAIVEHLRSFISGTEPYPRLIAVEERVKPWTSFWERVVSSVWYESAVQYEYDETLKEAIVTGSGYLRVRPNQFFRESTFNVVVESIPWEYVYVDPSSKKPDFTDADVICIARPHTMLKAEKEFGIKLDEDDINDSIMDPSIPGFDMPYASVDVGTFGSFDKEEDQKRTRQVWVKEFYLKEVLTEYISPEGFISIQLPTQTTIFNPQKEELMMYAQQLSEQLAQMPQGQNTEEAQMRQQEFQPILDELAQVEQIIPTLPDYVQVYALVTESGDTYHVQSYDIRQKKRIQYILQVHKKTIKEEWLPTDEFPIVPFHFSHFKAPYRTFGVIHYIKDVVKALNKLWALLVYDTQLKSSLRIIAPTNSIQDMAKWESKFSIPGSINLYEPDPSLKDNGRPEVLEPSETSSQLPALISMLVSLAEYITGIFSVMQGNQESAPNTFGTTQALQSFGSQRIKLLAKQLERSLNLVVYNIVVFAQRYAPKEKLALALDPEMHQDLETILAATDDARYKVRTSITKSLPTSRHMAANMFMILAGQVADPALQQLLAREGIKFLDILETDKLSDKMDLVTELQEHISQLEQQLEDQQKEANIMKNNAVQKDAALELEKAKGDIKAKQASVETEIDMQLEGSGE